MTTLQPTAYEIRTSWKQFLQALKQAKGASAPHPLTMALRVSAAAIRQEEEQEDYRGRLIPIGGSTVPFLKDLKDPTKATEAEVWQLPFSEYLEHNYRCFVLGSVWTPSSIISIKEASAQALWVYHKKQRVNSIQESNIVMHWAARSHVYGGGRKDDMISWHGGIFVDTLWFSTISRSSSHSFINTYPHH